MKIFTPLLSTTEKAAQDGLREGGREILANSNRRAPRDDDDLVKSGGVRIDDLTMQVAYTAKHAPYQHERLDFAHPNGGEAKFLESAAAEVDVERYVADEIGRALGG